MKDFFILARRNVLRNARRSLLTVLVIVLGMTFVFTIRGFLNGLQSEIKEGLTKAELGEVQIVHKGFRESLPAKANDYLFDYTPELKQIVGDTPHVASFTGRILVSGLLNHQISQTTTPMLGIGIDPEGEARTCPRLAELVKPGGGKFLQTGLEQSAKLAANVDVDIGDAPMDTVEDFSKPVPRADAKDLPTTTKEFHQIIIGEYMRRGLYKDTANGVRQAQLGDEMIVLAQDINGSQRSMEAHLTGILDVTNPTANKLMTYMVLSTAQELIGAQGKVTQIIISLDDDSNRFTVAKALSAKLAKFDLIAEPWDEINKFFVTIMGLQNMMFGIITSIIIVFVLVAIIITTMMSVSERTREIGTLMAIGYKRRHIMTLFVLESAIVGAAGGVLGAIMGTIVVSIMGAVGIPFQIPGTETPIVMHPFNSIAFTIFIAFLGVISGVLGAIYPARSASKMSPLEAMVHI